MKKIFTLVAAAMMAGFMMAETVVTFSGADFTGGTEKTGSAFSVTKDGVTVSSDKAYGTGSELRVYAGGVLEIEAESNIASIEFTHGKNTKMELENATPGSTSYSADATKQVRLTQIVVTLGEGGGGGDTPSGGVKMSGFEYADLIYLSDYDYWVFDLYADSETGYPEFYAELPAKSATKINGKYTLDEESYVGYWKTENDSVEFVSGSLTVAATGKTDDYGYPYYKFTASFENEDGKVYSMNMTLSVAAYDESYSEIELEDEEQTLMHAFHQNGKHIL